uniref:C-type lectin domain-containing protein n=1 Tax=Stegastes partitus TaxID=144197 RepID=A0A3B5A6S1_9TELE
WLKWYSSKCWAHRPFYFPWSRALEYCRDNASVLSTVTELNKENFTWIGWIGLFSEDGHTWSWLDNSTFTYTNWARNDSLLMDCATFTASSKKWHDCRIKSQRFLKFFLPILLINPQPL